MKHLFKFWIQALVSALVIGCAYNSTYHQPQVPVAANWSVPNRYWSESTVTNLPYLAWWQGFNDPQLTSLIESGIVNNNSLNMSRGHIAAAAGELEKVHFQWIPDINALLGYSNNPATGFPGLLALIVPSYTLNIFSQIKQQQQAKYQLAAAKAEDDSIKLSIISQIAASYFTYVAEIERQQLYVVLARDINHQAAIARKIYQGGLSSELNVEDLAAQVALIHGEQQVVAQNIIFSRNALQFLINQNPGPLTSSQPFAHLNNTLLQPRQLPLTVLANRPDMQQAENRLRAANEGIGLAASELLPTVKLDYFGGPVGGNNNYYFPGNLMANSVNFNDELLQVPLFKMSAFGAIATARGLDKVAYFNYINTLQKALRDASNAIAANEYLTTKLLTTEAAAAHLAKAYNLNERLSATGVQSYLASLESKVAFDRIKISVNQDKLQQLITVVNLYQELAGGFKAGSGESSSASAN